MKIKKIMATLMAMTIATSIMACGGEKAPETDAENKPGTETSTEDKKEDILNVGVLLYKFDDTYISTVRQNLEKIQKENSDKVNFTFYDGKGDQSQQNDTIDTIMGKSDILLVNLVDTGAAQTVISKIQSADIPVVLFNREPATEDIKKYDKAVFVGTNAQEAGVLQGKILVKEWENNPSLDKNGDGKIQYVMLKGEPDNPEAIARTKFSVSTINDAGIETEELANQVCNWEQALAQNAMEAWLSRYGDEIEVVIANNDGMAQGAVTALQAQGLNKGEADKMVPVVGVDATAAAQDLIEKGQMTGSVLQDAEKMAKALYETALNMASGKSAIDGTEYKFDETGVAIRIPYKEFVK